MFKVIASLLSFIVVAGTLMVIISAIALTFSSANKSAKPVPKPKNIDMFIATSRADRISKLMQKGFSARNIKTK